MDQHPSWDDILDTLEDRGPAGVQDHVKTCGDCGKSWTEAAALMARLEGARLPAPPRAWVDAALARVTAGERSFVGEAWSEWVRSLGRKLEEVAASLVADSLTPSHAVRGTTEAAPRLLLYETESYTVSLSLTPNDAGTDDLAGQVSPRAGDELPPDGKAGLATPEAVTETGLNTYGEFRFAGLSSGACRLSIVLGDELIQVGPFGRST